MPRYRGVDSIVWSDKIETFLRTNKKSPYCKEASGPHEQEAFAYVRSAAASLPPHSLFTEVDEAYDEKERDEERWSAAMSHFFSHNIRDFSSLPTHLSQRLEYSFFVSGSFLGRDTTEIADFLEYQLCAKNTMGSHNPTSGWCKVHFQCSEGHTISKVIKSLASSGRFAHITVAALDAAYNRMARECVCENRRSEDSAVKDYDIFRQPASDGEDE